MAVCVVFGRIGSFIAMYLIDVQKIITWLPNSLFGVFGEFNRKLFEVNQFYTFITKIIFKFNIRSSSKSVIFTSQTNFSK